MGETPSVLETLFTNVSDVITHLVSMMSTMTTSLLGNHLFQIVLGIVFFSIVMGIVFGLVRKIRKRGK